MQNRMIERFSIMLNCTTMNIPFLYLGIKVGANHRKKVFWNDMIINIRKRLSKWKGRHLSFAGRVMLIKSVISTIPLYYLSIFKMPVSVGKIIRKLQREFLWGWGHEGRKIAWVRWEHICRTKEDGGLGVKDLDKFNIALLGKWKWRLGKEEPGLWKDIVLSKYESWRKLDDKKVCSHDSWWWRDIRKICGGGCKENWFDKNIRWNRGIGNKINFWDDLWLGEIPLKDKYLRLYTNSILKKAKLGDAGYWNGENWVWNLQWRREWFEWEKDTVANLMREVEGTTLLRDREDERIWNDDETKVYTVNSAYKKLNKSNGTQQENLFELFWKMKALPSAQYFAWRVIINRVATYDNLQNRGVEVGSKVCVMCHCCDETVTHLFFSCRIAARLWKMCDSWLGLYSVHHNSAEIHFLQFEHLGLSKSCNIVWRCMWVATIWSIWNQRNNIIFRNAKVDVEEMFSLAQVKTWVWIIKKYPRASFSYSDWCLCPTTCLKLMRL